MLIKNIVFSKFNFFNKVNFSQNIKKNTYFIQHNLHKIFNAKKFKKITFKYFINFNP